MANLASYLYIDPYKFLLDDFWFAHNVSVFVVDLHRRIPNILEQLSSISITFFLRHEFHVSMTVVAPIV